MAVVPHDPGGSVRMKLLPGVDGAAEFSACGRYRYWLKREWGFRRNSDGREPYAMFIGMNPSTAEAQIDDPTIRREVIFTRALGLDCYCKTNVMDYRATFPASLLDPDVIPCSDNNLNCIKELAGRASIIVAAWGAMPKRLRKYADAAVEVLRGFDLYCFGETADGSPRHPLYLRRDTKPRLWRAADGERTICK